MTRSVNWPDLPDELAPLRCRWDVPVLVGRAAGPMRPGDLVKIINSQSGTGPHISWKVLTDTVRRLEAGDYVARRQVPAVPRETWYWLQPAGQRLLCAMAALQTWFGSYDAQDSTANEMGWADGQNDGAIDDAALVRGHPGHSTQT